MQKQYKQVDQKKFQSIKQNIQKIKSQTTINYNHNKEKINIVAVSDTHGSMKILNQLLPLKGDIFIHAGDFTYYGQQKHFQQFFQFLDQLNFKHKIVISGNHQIMLDDNCIQPMFKKKKLEKYKCLFTKAQLVKQLKKRCIYLQHQFVQIQGIKIFGSPYTPFYCGSAFQYHQKYQNDIWNAVPEDIDILITHGPPLGVLDFTKKQKNAGSGLLQKLSRLYAPKYHIFGHIHQGSGVQKRQNTIYANVANKPFQFFYEKIIKSQ